MTLRSSQNTENTLIPSTIETGKYEEWNGPTLTPEIRNEDEYKYSIPAPMKLNITTAAPGKLRRALTDPEKHVELYEVNGNNRIQKDIIEASSGDTKIEYWKDPESTDDVLGYELNLQTQKFDAALSAIYDVLYGIGQGDLSTEQDVDDAGYAAGLKFKTRDRATAPTSTIDNVVAQQGLINILNNMTAIIGSDTTYYTFNNKWISSLYDGKTFIENIPEVITATGNQQGTFKIDLAQGFTENTQYIIKG